MFIHLDMKNLGKDILLNAKKKVISITIQLKMLRKQEKIETCLKQFNVVKTIISNTIKLKTPQYINHLYVEMILLDILSNRLILNTKIQL